MQLGDRLLLETGTAQHLGDGEVRARDPLHVRGTCVVHEELQLGECLVRLADLRIRQARVVGAVLDERVRRGEMVPVVLADIREQRRGAAVLPGREQCSRRQRPE